MHKKMVTLKITSNFSPVFYYNSIHYSLVCVSCPPSVGNDMGYNSIHNEKFFGFFKKISKENMISLILGIFFACCVQRKTTGVIRFMTI